MTATDRDRTDRAAQPAAATADAVAAKAARRGLELRDIVLTVMLGAVFGFLYWALVQAWNALAIAMGPAGDLAQHVLFGGWLIVAPIAIMIIRRPFVGIIAEMIAATIEFVFLGSPVGPLLLLAAAIQGFGSELPFMVTRYKKYTWTVFALSGALGAGLVFFYSGWRSGWYGQDIFFLRLVMQVVSGIILGGLLARIVVQALARTGVLDEFAIGRVGATPRTAARLAERTASGRSSRAAEAEALAGASAGPEPTDAAESPGDR